MALPQSLSGRLRLPAIAAPMFLASGPDLVVEACKAGVIGTFPALNQRTSEGYEAWLEEVQVRLADAPAAAPFGVNLIVHRSNARLSRDLDLTVSHRVPIVITSLGAAREVADAVHSYGGLIFHDVINRRHAEKAAEAGVDGIIAVSAGAGGHAGTMSPFALISEIAQVFSGTIILSGSIGTGAQIAAARMMGADLAYMGTRFLATRQSMVDAAYKLPGRACLPDPYGDACRRTLSAGLLRRSAEPVPQEMLLDLAHRVLRQCVDEFDAFWHIVAGLALAHEGLDLGD